MINKAAGGKVNHFPPNFVHRDKDPLCASTPPTHHTASGGRRFAWGQNASRKGGQYIRPPSRSSFRHRNAKAPRTPRFCPPRVGQVSFASSLDTYRNILTYPHEASIVIYRRKEPRPALCIAEGIAQTLFGLLLRRCCHRQHYGEAPPLKMGV